MNGIVANTDRLEQLLKDHFGFTSFRHNQQAIIENVLAGKDSMVLMPTGGGKSICYQLPALAMDGLAIVVSPLIALMKDQVDALHLNGIEAAFLNSTLSLNEQQLILQRLPSQHSPAREDHLKLLYISPERLLGERNFLHYLKENTRVCLFAIDEAHCISSWGHDFRPEYLLLGELKKQFPSVPVVALTATADKRTKEDIIDKLGFSHYTSFENSFNRPNISYYIKPRKHYFEQLCAYLKTHDKDAGIIYCLSRANTEDLAAKLQARGFQAEAYHAGLEKRVRDQRQEQFLRDEIRIIVATIAFGMGINKSNVRYVIHTDMPKNLEGYYQETGRAGRDGLASEAILYYSAADLFKLRNFAKVEDNEEQSAILLQKLRKMADYCELRTCRRKFLLNYFGEAAGNECGSCDVCLTDAVKTDMTIAAQKALSAVSRLQERFGMNYVIDFLRGSSTVKPFHQSLKTWGAGKEFSKDQWRSFLRELIHLGHLQQSEGEYPLLQLTESSWQILRGAQTVLLTTISEEKKVSKERGAGISYTTVIDEETGVTVSIPMEGDAPQPENDLFEELKLLRKKIAVKENVPPYIVFSDATLTELATYLPITSSDIAKISGFGAIKLAKYGEAFLDAVQNYCIRHQLKTRIEWKAEKRKR
ncbi:DNA helicase RecQ [Filimonas effusa]|uniref:DNA helicase RecQ n=1 Tax=Filimonas effusa TaxID=2508721 RepID=A0A4Q1D154_9BACT|nr:DNA helicase RecQ [Filimonas effusa]RXK80725.1 DNA helicase RecQ [Filimonas effusa]